MSKQASTPPMSYDVFISYNQAERDWVAHTLVPKLEAEGLSVCVDYRDFKPGDLGISAISTAIEQSRCTLVVLSPAYLNDSLSNLVINMAKTLALELKQRRLLSVMRRQCVPPLTLRIHPILDLTEDGQSQTAFTHLVQEIQHLL